MTFRYGCAIVVSIVLAGVGIAAGETTIFGGDIYDLVMSDPVAVGVGAGGESLVAFTVTVFNVSDPFDAGYHPVALDNDYFGYTGITGKLHQHYSTLLGSYSPEEGDAYATAIDSHWVETKGPSITRPSENYAVWASSEPTDAGFGLSDFAETSFGAHMDGTFSKTKAEGDDTPDWTLARLVSQPGEVISFNFFPTGIKGGEHIVASYTVAQGAGAWVDVGQDSAGEFGGGAEGIGGLEFVFDDVTSEGAVLSDYSLGALPGELAGTVDFDLPGVAQLWEISFTGEFNDQIVLTFRYFHETLPGGLDENDLAIYHQLDNGQWELLPILSRDPAAYTITVVTDSFSPFALGQVPEPATMGLLAFGAAALLRRRKT